MKDLVFEPTSQAVEAEALPPASPKSNGSVASKIQVDLQPLTALRDQLAACFDVPEAERIITAARELHAQCSGPECAALLAGMEAEIAHCRLAVSALEHDHIEECREHCDNVLREKPHHSLFLGLRVKANAAAHAAEYSQQMASVARIRALLDCGPLEDAQNASKSALARFPDSPELCELDLDIREKAIHLRNLVERGETALDIFDVAGAGHCFLRACEQLPFDLSLSGYIVSVLHEFAAKAVQKNWQSARNALDLAQRVQPGSQTPAAITAALEREMSAGTTIRQAEQVSVASVPAEPEVLAAASPVQPPTDEPAPEAAFIELDSDSNARPSPRSLKAMVLALAVAAALFIVYRAARPASSAPKHVLEISGVAAGTLTIHSNLAGAHLLINNRPFDMPAHSLSTTIKLPPGVYAIRATLAGYAPAGPIAAPVNDGAVSEIEVALKALPASLEIRQAMPGMKLSLDGHPLGTVSKEGTFHSPIEPGQHTLQLAQNGFLPRTIHAKFAPGQPLPITGGQVMLDSTDARTQPRQTGKADVSGLLNTLPAAALRTTAPAPLAQIPPPLPQPAHFNHPAEPAEAALGSPSAPIPQPRKPLKIPSAQEQADSAAVLAVLERFANAWSAKDLKAITAMQADLDKRALKAQLASVKVLLMKISPVMPPQIDGGQATVVCRRQAAETFSDGSARQNPPALVTYVLAKRDGVWHIEHAR